MKNQLCAVLCAVACITWGHITGAAPLLCPPPANTSLKDEPEWSAEYIGTTMTEVGVTRQHIPGQQVVTDIRCSRTVGSARSRIGRSCRIIAGAGS